MTNTLTWDIKPIAFPKINANLLSVVSLILILTMAFLTASAIAEHCSEIRKKLETAIAVEAAAIAAVVIAKEVLKAAGASGIHWAITAATIALAVAIGAVAAAGVAIGYYAAALAECEQEHETASGGCNSGSCGSG